MRRMVGKPKTFTVDVSAGHGRITFDPCHLHVIPGDTIVWKLDGGHAFAIIVKDFMSPLEWGSKVAAKGARMIRSVVLEDADYGLYEYAICAVEGNALLVADPEIIVRPPDGREK